MTSCLQGQGVWPPATWAPSGRGHAVKRILWFGLGIAAGVAASRKASAKARRMTPAGAAENVSDAVRELATAVGSFGADVRAGIRFEEA